MSSADQHTENSDGKIATESSPAGMNSITNTVGMHPSTHETLPTPPPSHPHHGSCDKPGCTAEHSGKPHE